MQYSRFIKSFNISMGYEIPSIKEFLLRLPTPLLSSSWLLSASIIRFALVALLVHLEELPTMITWSLILFDFCGVPSSLV